MTVSFARRPLCARCGNSPFKHEWENCTKTDCPGPPPPDAEPVGPAVREVYRKGYKRHEFLQFDGSYLLCGGPGRCAVCNDETDAALKKRNRT